MSDIICPKCRHEHSIADMELWEVYAEAGKETEIDCENCEAPLIITSQVTDWHFDVEVDEL